MQLPRFAVEALRTHRAAQREERIAAGVATSEGLVFVTRRGAGPNGRLRSVLDSSAAIA